MPAKAAAKRKAAGTSSAGTKKAKKTYEKKKTVSSSLQRAVGNANEKNFVDTDVSFLSSDAVNGNIFLFNTFPQGTSVNQRVGKKIALTGCQFRGTLRNRAVSGDFIGSQFIICMIVYDKRPTGALPAVTDIVLAVGGGPKSISLNNDTNSGRFSIVRRWTMTLCGSTQVVAGPLLTSNTGMGIDDWVDLKARPTVYKAGGTGAIGDIEEGALYFVTVGDSNSNGDYRLNGNVRTRALDV